MVLLSDPVSVLEHAQNVQKKAHKAQDLEIENRQLRETLAEYNHEFAEVKNQGTCASVDCGEVKRNMFARRTNIVCVV